MENPTLLEQIQAMLVNNNEILKNDINNTMNNVNSKMNSLKADLKNINEKVGSLQAEGIASREENLATRDEVLARIAARSRASSRVSSRALSSRHLAVTRTATIPVFIVPTVLKIPPLRLTVPGIESSPSHIDSTLSVTNTSVLGSPESLETVIKVPVRTTGSLYDIAPTTESNHATEELPMDISPDMVTEELNSKESVIVCDFNHQLSVSTQQLGYLYPIPIEDDSCGSKHGCFSEHCNTTLYTVLGAVHIPMTAILVS